MAAEALRGVFSPYDSGVYIASNADYVKINENALDKLSEEMLSSINDGKLEIPDTGANITYPSKDDPSAIDWIFVADALNFCFWSYTDAEKWTVDGHSGYYALEAALSRALKEGYKITKPEYYSTISADTLQKIMRSDNNTEIPLFQERLNVLHEVSKVLIDKYDGTFKTCLEKANKSALKLLEIVIENFPCFRDEGVFKGKNVSYYKRAQILIGDIWNFYGGQGLGEFTDIDKVTIFADYRLPQVLMYFGVFTYKDELMDKLKNDVLLPHGSQEEQEILGCTIYAVELLKKRIEEKILSNKINVEIPNSCLIDYYLWCYRRKHAEELKSIPFHKTLSIYY